MLLGVLVMCGGLALAEVIVLYPRAGGNYVFLREGYGRLWGFLWGWIEFFVIRSASIAALATVFTESLHDVLRHPAVRAALGLAPTGPVLDFWPLQGVTVGHDRGAGPGQHPRRDAGAAGCNWWSRRPRSGRCYSSPCCRLRLPSATGAGRWAALGLPDGPAVQDVLLARLRGGA